VAELRRDRVAVAGRAAARIRLPAGRDDDLRREQCARRRYHREATLDAIHIAQRFASARVAPLRSNRARSALSTSKRSLDTGNLAVSSTFVATPSAWKKSSGVLHAEGREGRVQEPARRAVGGDNAAVVGGMGDVAARAAD